MRVARNESGKVIGSLDECTRTRNENEQSGLGQSANTVDFARPIYTNRARLSFINETPTLMTESGSMRSRISYTRKIHTSTPYIRARPAEKFGRKQDSFRSLSENLPIVSQHGTFHVIGRIS